MGTKRAGGREKVVGRRGREKEMGAVTSRDKKTKRLGRRVP